MSNAETKNVSSRVGVEVIANEEANYVHLNLRSTSETKLAEIKVYNASICTGDKWLADIRLFLIRLMT